MNPITTETEDGTVRYNLSGLIAFYVRQNKSGSSYSEEKANRTIQFMQYHMGAKKLKTIQDSIYKQNAVPSIDQGNERRKLVLTAQRDTYVYVEQFLQNYDWDQLSVQKRSKQTDEDQPKGETFKELTVDLRGDLYYLILAKSERNGADPGEIIEDALYEKYETLLDG